jgi:hypothetical protein
MSPGGSSNVISMRRLSSRCSNVSLGAIGIDDARRRGVRPRCYTARVREIEDAANKKRAAEEAATAARARADAMRPAREEAARRFQRKQVFTHTLGGGSNVETALIGLGLALPIAGLLWLDIAFKLSGVLEWLVFVVGGGLALVAVFGVSDFLQGLIARARLAGFARSNPWLDRTAYHEAISENRRTSVLDVRVDFTGSWPTRREDVIDAVMTWATLKSVAWDGDTLVLTSEPLETTETSIGRGSRYTFFTNRKIHLCFSHLAHHVLPKLAAVTPIRGVTWTIDGQIEPWDARASLTSLG